MIKCLRSKPGVKYSAIQSIKRELLQEFKTWCLGRMHLLGAFYLCPSQPSVLSRCAVPLFLYLVLVSARYQAFSWERPYKLFSDKIMQKITAQLTAAAQFTLQGMERGCSNALLIPTLCAVVTCFDWERWNGRVYAQQCRWNWFIRVQ